MVWAALLVTPLAAQERPGGLPTVPASARYVASSRGQVYYPVGCEAWHELSPRNLLFFDSAEGAEARGYRPTRNRQCRGSVDLSTLAPAGGAAGAGSGAGREGATGTRAATGQEAGVCVVARIVDGDTLDCAGGLRIRLLLIDAPETAQSSYGLRAKLALEELAAVGDSLTVRLDVQERDRYGRVLAHLFRPDGTWVNRAMVRRGYAVPLVYPPNVWRVEEIRAATDSARAEEAGLWAEGGFRCLPRDFRRGACGG